MTDKLKQIIKEELVKLPKASQEVINSFDWGTISEEIGKKYLLSEDEINSLQVEISLILLEVVENDLFALNIENRVGTSKNEATKIAEEINQKIFVPMLEKRESLIKNRIQADKLDWKKSINCIVSGGDYSVFMEEDNLKV